MLLAEDLSLLSHDDDTGRESGVRNGDCVPLLTATKDVNHSHAAVLAELLRE